MTQYQAAINRSFSAVALTLIESTCGSGRGSLAVGEVEEVKVEGMKVEEGIEMEVEV